ncbi:MAG: type IV toxin-antitoxin system AbiEi family antitoxin domain-containing protein [Candidatus Kryptoniota bacterium]
MRKKAKELITFFKSNNGIVRFSDILRAGFHPDSLKTLEEEKKVEKIARGLYKLANYAFEEHPDLVIASLQAPKGVICLVSALSFHEATLEIPKYVDIAIPRGTHTYRIKYPPVRFYRFDIKTWDAGIEEHKIKGHKIKVYNLARTIADCFKFRNKIGINVARESLKIAITEKNIKLNEIMKYAKICRVDSIIKPMLEAVL